MPIQAESDMGEALQVMPLKLFMLAFSFSPAAPMSDSVLNAESL